MPDGLDKYVKPHLFDWYCSCGFRESVRLFLRPQKYTRACPECGGTAYLREQAIIVNGTIPNEA